MSKDRDADIRAFLNEIAAHIHDHGEDDGEITSVAIFGSRSLAGGITHQIVGNLVRRKREADVSYRLAISNSRASDALSSPPRALKPVSLLIEAASQVFGTIKIDCDFRFEYKHTLGFKSKISFPIPLVLQEETVGITHMESAQFSRRHNDDIQYRVLVANSENNDEFSHWITFEDTLVLNQNSVRKMFARARSISTQLLIKEEGD